MKSRRAQVSLRYAHRPGRGTDPGEGRSGRPCRSGSYLLPAPVFLGRPARILGSGRLCELSAHHLETTENPRSSGAIAEVVADQLPGRRVLRGERVRVPFDRGGRSAGRAAFPAPPPTGSKLLMPQTTPWVNVMCS